MTIEVKEEQIIELVMSSWRLLRKIENNHSNIMHNIDGRGDQDMIPYKEITNEFDELFKDAGIDNPLNLVELEPIYQVFFEGRKESFKIFKNLDELEKEFSSVEPDLKKKVNDYLRQAASSYNDTNDMVVKTNFNGTIDYLL